MKPILYTLSIVSHGQSYLIRQLIDDLQRLEISNIEVIITINIPEDESPFMGLSFRSKIIRNKIPKGFGANHNSAFKNSSGEFFIIINPDIRLPKFNLSLLLSSLSDPEVGAVAPVVLNSAGKVEDSARRFPTVTSLLRRVLLGQREPDYTWGSSPIKVDWTAGMFIVFRREAFKAVGGFDDSRFFMYFEDVDICERLWRSGWCVLFDPKVEVIHDAQRASRRSIRHLRWHLTSAIRYLVNRSRVIRLNR